MRLGIMLAPLLLGACAGSYEAPRLTEKQTAELEKALAGKVPGEKVSCVTMRPQGSFRVISGNIVLYRMSSKLIYKNELIGSCPGLTRGDTMIIRPFGSQYCRGDIARSADLTIGMTTGTCALGDFTPYRTPGK
ncbi:hypothetical protein [Sphingobium sp. CFD-1]|jgi:hypothetical protein|uniref:hypothetical protein n=1 Tax=Sphingobium sp. CFD-1 TaxID=2878545 RepID=UPI00214ABF5C|nr:hypothetical protein [Sphingobium sp. CFD-1]